MFATCPPMQMQRCLKIMSQNCVGCRHKTSDLDKLAWHLGLGSNRCLVWQWKKSWLVFTISTCMLWCWGQYFKKSTAANSWTYLDRRITESLPLYEWFYGRVLCRSHKILQRENSSRPKAILSNKRDSKRTSRTSENLYNFLSSGVVWTLRGLGNSGCRLDHFTGT